jgi:hypothetical protein
MLTKLIFLSQMKWPCSNLPSRPTGRRDASQSDRDRRAANFKRKVRQSRLHRRHLFPRCLDRLRRRAQDLACGEIFEVCSASLRYDFFFPQSSIALAHSSGETSLVCVATPH